MDVLNFLASSSDAAGVAVAGGVAVIQMIVGIAVYLVFGFALMTIAKKLGEENGWWGFIPILNFVLIVKLAQKEMWWVILFFVPCANLVAMILCMNAIAARRGKPDWLGYLMLVPCVNICVPLYIAFSD